MADLSLDNWSVTEAADEDIQANLMEYDRAWLPDYTLSL